MKGKENSSLLQFVCGGENRPVCHSILCHEVMAQEYSIKAL